MRLRYKLGLFIVTLGMALCFMTYQSYALWIVNLKGEENIVETGCFQVTYEEVNAPISLNNTYPMSDTKGLSGTPYTFKIKNTCSVSAGYSVTLNTLTTNTMSKDKIKYAISKTKPTKGINLGSNTNINTDTASLNIENLDESIIIETGTLENQNDEVTYNVYLWIDEVAGNEVKNTRFESSIHIISSAIKPLPKATEYITNLASTSSELVYDGTVDNNLRYVGANPNNYVKIDNSLWRIIGVMNNIDDGTGKKETKLKLFNYFNSDSSLLGKYDEFYLESGSTTEEELNGVYASWKESGLSTLF